MKRIYAILAAVLLFSGLFLPQQAEAQSPEKMNYQAVMRHSNQSLATNAIIGMKISILKGSANGTAVYVETQTPLSNANGLVTIEIGSGSTTGNFSDINWANGPFFIKTEADLNGGSNYTIISTSELLSVPFALHSKAAENVAVSVSATGDTLYIGYEQWVIVPGISEANSQSGTTVIDVDGNVYQTVIIGTQEWLAENLKTTKFKNGTSIPLVTSNVEWSNLSTPAYCWYNNNQTTYGNTYGALYNWQTVATGNLCPTGWHVPTDAEWTKLTDYLGGLNVAGGKLKETGTAHWHEPNNGATNESGFTALPGGLRYDNGDFFSIEYGGNWWSSTQYSATNAWDRSVDFSVPAAGRFDDPNKWGLSIRCLKD